MSGEYGPDDVEFEAHGRYRIKLTCGHWSDIMDGFQADRLWLDGQTGCAKCGQESVPVVTSRPPRRLKDSARDEAQQTLRKLDQLWDELWSQQFDPPPKRENDEIVERVHTGPPGSRLLHTGTPGELQRYYLNVQHALRDAWQTLGGTWHTDHTSTLPPAAMRRIGRLLADMLADPNTSTKAVRKACGQVMDGWWGLPEGLRGEPKGGAKRCKYDDCTDPAQRGRSTCGRCRYRTDEPAPVMCVQDDCWNRIGSGDTRTCAACRKRKQRQQGAA